MIKKIMGLLIAVVSLFTIVACKNESVNLTLSGYQNSYTVGDTFSTDGLKVLADEKDVTGECEIDYSSVNMEVPGTYAIIVEYNGVQKTYTITVSEKTNVETLVSLELDTTNVKLDYLVGETFDSSNLGLIAEYENSDGNTNTTKYITDLTSFTINVMNEDGEVVSGAFTEDGIYNVAVSQNAVSSSFPISVTKGALTIANAVDVAYKNKNLVAGGENSSDDSNTDNYYGQVTSAYAFGQDLNTIEYTYENQRYTENYFIGSDGKVIGIRVNHDFANDPDSPNYDPFAKPMTILENIDERYTSGLEYTAFAATEHYVGAENFLIGLYETGKTNPNLDYKESITKYYNDLGEEQYIYNFSYGLLKEMQTGSVYYLNFIDVTFTLGEGNFLESLDVKNDVYVVSDLKTQFEIYPKDEIGSDVFYDPDRVLPGNDYPEDFPVIPDGYNINDCVGRLKSNPGSPSSHYSNSHSVRQYSGERNAINEYPENEIYVSQYDILDSDGNIINEGEQIDYIVDNYNGTPTYATELTITNFNSDLAKELDSISIYVTYDGEKKAIGTFSDDSSFLTLYYDVQDDNIRIRCHRYGLYEFELVTYKTTRHFSIFADYQPPTTFISKIYRHDPNPTVAGFIQGDSMSCFVGDTVYFNAEANAIYGDPEYTVTCSDPNATIIERPVENLPEYLMTYTEQFSSFVASQPGTYVLTLKSTRNNVSSTLTITVLPEPDFTEKLTGEYTFEVVTATGKDTGYVNFVISDETVSDSGIIHGEVTIKVGEYEEVVRFTYQNRKFTECVHISGAEGRISLSLDSDLNVCIAGSYRNDANEIVYSFDSVLARAEG